MFQFPINIPWERLNRYHLAIFLFCIVIPSIASWQHYWYFSFPSVFLTGIIASIFHRWELDDNWIKKALAKPSVEDRWQTLRIFSIIFFLASFLFSVGWLIVSRQPTT
jgi:hypothetical protein